MDDFTKSAQRFLHWCQGEALPYWAQHGLDPAGGGYEYLNRDGSPSAQSLRRVRVQARQAYVYAHAGALGWYKDVKPVSDHFWNYLIGAGFQGGDFIDGQGFKGCAHLLNPDGSVHDGSRDTYAQAFVILAGAWRYKAFKDESALAIAKQTLAFLDTHVKADNGGWLEGMPANLPRRQNPHMHMFEALLALYDASGEAEYLERAGTLYQLFETVFFDAKSGSIIEFFDVDWSRAKNNGGPIEPGHMMEWCWLLREYEARSGVDVGRIADKLYSAALKGLNPQTGLLYDRMNCDGSINQATHRTWVQTEFLKASLAQAKAGHTDQYAQAATIIDILFETYLNVGQRGGWGDQLDSSGALISPNMPASTFYHWLCAAAAVNDGLATR